MRYVQWAMWWWAMSKLYKKTWIFTLLSAVTYISTLLAVVAELRKSESICYNYFFIYLYRGKQFCRGKTCCSSSRVTDSSLPWFPNLCHVNIEYWNVKFTGLNDLACIYCLVIWVLDVSPPNVTSWGDTIITGMTNLSRAINRF